MFNISFQDMCADYCW